MRNSPLFMAALYFLLGCIFTYLAIINVEDTIWNFYTLLLAGMATIDFNLALRLILVKFKTKTKKEQ
ncbi:YdiK family protein [Bacillus sp. DX1.1]|uniref:YdiK family protein n=1 Tax=unclassified Bacillus (in: firmicutes) TaxID=185979 RepID=UPI00256FB8D2|nr:MULTISPECIES: YdiK family protein [unclassified Bacillus (in: firmicutes)]MDM5153074.1 YdiK family protein [Bacillus sp. DX1.1]WJE82047.1 YdiK family protein [Bacillus sp. DX3.1]